VSDGYGQGCPIAVALDVIGERWTLLLLRDLVHAPMRFTDLAAINPKVSPNLLSKRLRALQDHGLVRRRQLPPPAAATVYELDDRARNEILPILNALGRFGAFVFTSAPAGTAGTVEAVLAQMRLNAHWVLAKGIDFEAEFRLKLGPYDIGLVVGPAVFEPTPHPPEEPTATIESDLVTMTNLFNARLTLADAEDGGTLRISGDRDAALVLLDRLALGPHLRTQR
jgi:DNA-binding HxlR family transcriptional regulator